MVQVATRVFLLVSFFGLSLSPVSGVPSEKDQPGLDSNTGKGIVDNPRSNPGDHVVHQTSIPHNKISIWTGVGNVVTDLRDLPSEPKSVKGIRYLVRYKTKASTWSLINDKYFKLADNLDKTGPVKILVHGFTPGFAPTAEMRMNTSKILYMGDAYYAANNVTNVIVMDWTSLSSYKHIKYSEAVLSVPHAAKDLADLIVYLHKRNLIQDLKKVHLIGFSLGAHVCGVAGFRVKRKLGKAVGRISGIDPSGAHFHINGKLPKNMDDVLDPSDADFVDVIHCNMGSHHIPSKLPELDFDFGNYGTPAKCGHVDFYPNGGIRQTGCTYWTDKAYCSHNKCPEIFLDTIRGTRKVGCECADWKTFQAGKCKCDINNGGNYIGDPAQKKNQNGTYYLEWP